MNKPASRVRLFSLHFLSVTAVLGCDWFIYAGNVLTQMEAVTAWVVTGSVSAALLTALAERQLGGASFRATVLKGSAALALVAAPLPLLGTLLAAFALAWGIAAAVTHAIAGSRSADDMH